MRRSLGFGGGVEELEVRGHGELDVHEQHVPLRQQEREVGDAVGFADHCSALVVVDAFVEAGETEHVFGHALAPLATSVRTGQRLAEAVGGGRQHVGDLGMHLQRPVDLAEPLGRRLPELLHQLRQPLDIGAHAGLHLAEALVDELALTGQSSIVGLAVGTELFTAHGDGLLDRQAGSLADDLGRDRMRDGRNAGRAGCGRRRAMSPRPRRPRGR